MTVILITGVSTSGKSTIARELQKRGYEAYDTERDGISAWYNKQTGKRTAEFGQAERTKVWFDKHEWLISKDWVGEAAAKAKSKPIFICGGSANELEIRSLCDKVIWLKTDQPTILSRVKNPRDHDYGTRPYELEAIITGNEVKENEYEEYGAIIIDATQPIEKVIKDILITTGL